jgi:hypothetical protein
MVTGAAGRVCGEWAGAGFEEARGGRALKAGAARRAGELTRIDTLRPNGILQDVDAPRELSIRLD